MSRHVDDPKTLLANGELFADPALRRQVLVVLAQQINQAKLQISGQWEEGEHLVRGALDESGARHGSERKVVLTLEVELDPYEVATTPGVLDIQKAALAQLSGASAAEAAEAASLLASQRLGMDALSSSTLRPARRSKRQPYSAMHERYRVV